MDAKNRHSIRLPGFDYSRAGAYFVTICTQNREGLLGEMMEGRMKLNAAGMMVNNFYKELESKFAAVRCDEHIIMPNHVHAVIWVVGADLCVRPLNSNRAHSENINRVRLDNANPVHSENINRAIPDNANCAHSENINRAIPDNANCAHSENINRAILDNANRARTNNKNTAKNQEIADNGIAINICEMGGHIGPPLPRIIQWFKTMTTNAYFRGVKNQGWRSLNGRLWQRSFHDRIVRNGNELDHIRRYIVNNPSHWAMDEENPAYRGQAPGAR